MQKITELFIKHAKTTILISLTLITIAGFYGFGLFDELKSSDNFFAKGTDSQTVNDKLKKVFPSSNDDSIIILFEKKPNTSVAIDSIEAKNETALLLEKLNPKTVIDYYSTGDASFLANDKTAAYSIITMDGKTSDQFAAITDFESSIKSDMFNISAGGALVGEFQADHQTEVDLGNAEMISLPILGVLLFIFFRSPIAAALPLIMSILTIFGALAVSRMAQNFINIDTYSLNIITILSVGLSIDYCLLAVNRFREELTTTRDPFKAAVKTSQTAGRTILFSGLTIAICLASLLFFPIDFIHSVSIGGISAAIIAVIISSVLLPVILYIIGNKIDKWHIGKKPKNEKINIWTKIAKTVTKKPLLSISIGVLIIAISAVPIKSLIFTSFDWRMLPSNLSSYHVGKVMDEKFVVDVPSITVLSSYSSTPTNADICKAYKTIESIDGVKLVSTAYSPIIDGVDDCNTIDQAIQYVSAIDQSKYAILSDYAKNYVSESYVRFDVVSKNGVTDNATLNLVTKLRSLTIDSSTVSVTGDSALNKDSFESYAKWMPVSASIIIISMIIILSLLLGSVVLPIQAVIINSLSLLITLGLVVAIFYKDIGANLIGAIHVAGFEPSILILIVVIAFGLSMDYAVFLYSRIHEIYDKTGDMNKAIIDGVTKTGPIITSASLLMFVVVAAFGLSHVVLIQQIGVGLSIAVLVDAFFVRIFFVPAVMKLLGRNNWLAPKWLKKITIKHD